MFLAVFPLQADNFRCLFARPFKILDRDKGTLVRYAGENVLINRQLFGVAPVVPIEGLQKPSASVFSTSLPVSETTLIVERMRALSRRQALQ